MLPRKVTSFNVFVTNQKFWSQGAISYPLAFLQKKEDILVLDNARIYNNGNENEVLVDWLYTRFDSGHLS
jgi:hypothetical protein